MTNQQGAPEAPPPAFVHYPPKKPELARVDFLPIATKAERSNGWVTVALVEAQQPAPSAAVALSDDLRDRLVAISEAIADQDDRAVQAMLREILAAPQPSPTPQADIQPAPQGETNAQLDIDSNSSAPGQQRDVAGSVALGQPVGNGSDQAAGHTGAQGDKLLIVAERNIRSFLRSAVFKSESDREAALNCVDVLWEAASAPADSVTAPAGGVVAGPSKWTVEEIADGKRGIRWVTEGVIHGRPTDHDVREYLTRTPAMRGCLCDDCKTFYAPTPPAQAADSVLEDAARLEALHAAVTAIYLDDSSDFKSALGAVVRHLDPKLAGDLLAWPKRAFDISQARLDAARKQGANHD